MIEYNYSNEELQSIIDSCHCWNEVLNKLGMKTMTRHLQHIIKKANINHSHISDSFNGLYKKLNKYTTDELKKIIKENKNWSDVMKILGYSSCIYTQDVKNKLDKLNINYDHLYLSDNALTKVIYTLDQILVKNSTYTNMSTLLRRLKRERNWEHKCSICNLTEWNGKPISLEIDHIDGCHSNNSYENLRTICPNCHAQTDTYKGKNMAVCKNNPAPPKPSPEPKPPPEKNHCIGCSKIIKNRNTQCNECRAKTLFEAGQYRKVERPSYEQLKKDILEMPIVQVGKKYGVSDNAIRKWLKKYEKYDS